MCQLLLPCWSGAEVGHGGSPLPSPHVSLIQKREPTPARLNGLQLHLVPTWQGWPPSSLPTPSLKLKVGLEPMGGWNKANAAPLPAKISIWKASLQLGPSPLMLGWGRESWDLSQTHLLLPKPESWGVGRTAEAQGGSRDILGLIHIGEFTKLGVETSLVVQWLGLQAPNAEDLGSIPIQGTRPPHAATKKSCRWLLKTPCVAAKTWYSPNK